MKKTTIKVIYDDAKKPDTAAAINALKDAYISGDDAKITESLMIAQNTIEESNHNKRKAFYCGICSDCGNDLNAIRREIIKVGYIKQDKLINKFDAKSNKRDIRLDTTEVQVDITEVNALTRAEIFSDDIEYLTSKFRKVVVAYVASEMEKTGIESVFGYDTIKYISGEKISINNMTRLLKDVFCEILADAPLAKKAYIKQISYWIATKTSKYGTKFATTKVVLSMITDILWSAINDRELECKFDEKTF